jgi:hypothetical protein
MIHHPKRDLGYSDGELFNFNAVKLIDVDLRGGFCDGAGCRGAAPPELRQAGQEGPQEYEFGANVSVAPSA